MRTAWRCVQYPWRRRPGHVVRASWLLAAIFSANLCQQGMNPRGDCLAEQPRQAIEIAKVERATPVDFNKEILPILRQNCVACHNERENEAHVVLDSRGSMLSGGDAGPLVLPGKAEESLLLHVASWQRDPHMPPADNKVGAAPLTPDQLGLIKLWIDQGALAGAVVSTANVVRRPPRADLQPILALALSSDDDYLACSRGPRIQVYNLRGPQFEAELADPSLSTSESGDRADVDLVRSLAFSRSGNLLASGGFRTVRLWQRPRARMLGEWTASLPVRCVAIDVDRKHLAVGTEANTIEWRALDEEGAPVQLLGHVEAPTAIAFTSRGLVSAGADKSLRWWQPPQSAPLATWTLAAPARALCWLPERDQLAVGAEDGSIGIWSMSDLVNAAGQAELPPAIRKFDSSGQAITCLETIAAWPNQLVASGDDGRVRIWDLETGQLSRETSHESPVYALAIRPDGQRLVTVGPRGARLWKCDDLSLVAELKADPRPARDQIRADGEFNYAQACVEFRKQEHRESEEALTREQAAVEGAGKAKEAAEKDLADKTNQARPLIEARDLAEQQAKQLADVLLQAGEHASSAQAAASDAEAAMQKAQAEQQAAQAALDLDRENKDLQAALAIAEQAQATARQARDAAHAALDAAKAARQDAEQKSQEAARAFETARQQAREKEREVHAAQNAHLGAVNFVATANAILEKAQAAVPGALARVQEAEAHAAELDRAKQALAERAMASLPALRACSFSADGKLLMMAGDGDAMLIVDATTGTVREIPPTAPLTSGGLRSLAADRWLAVSSLGRCETWQASDKWDLLRTINPQADPAVIVDRILALDFSPDGTLLATASGVAASGGELCLWNVHDGSLARRFATPHEDTICAVRFSPDGQWLATGSADRLVKLFRVADGQLVRTFAGHGQHVLGLAWSASGELLASCGSDQVIKLWNVQTGAATRTFRGTAYRIGEYRRAVTSISFVGNRDQFLASSGDKTVRLHRATNEYDLRAYVGAKSYLQAAVGTSDGKLVIGGGQDGILYFWNGESSYLLYSCTAQQPTQIIRSE